MAPSESGEFSYVLNKELGVSKSLLNMLEGDFGCPHLIYCVWKSGRHAVMRLTCKTWKCKNCSELKINQMTQYLADATIDNPILHEIPVYQHQYDNVARYLRRKKLPSLSIKFVNSVYVLTSQGVIGKDWQSNPIPRVDAVVKVASVDRLRIRRRDFTQDWKPESTYEPKRDSIVISRKFDSLNEARTTLAELGQDIDSDLVNGDPLVLMERFLEFDSGIVLEIASPT